MALTPDELRKRIPQWSLESDGQLLQYMNQISKNLEAKCKQTQDNLTRLMLDIDESHLRYANASNSFNGIQQLKYVENRVQDDDESFYSVREEKEEEGEKLPYGEVFHMAVEKSIANMYKSFEKVTVQLDSDSDSDDEEEAAVRNTVLRAVQKYPYISRPLPYIIGSQEWREKWHAGLIDSEEESDTEEKEQYSDSSDSEKNFPSQTNSNHTPSESEGSVWGVHADPRRRAPSFDPSVSGDDALSIHSSSSAIRPVGARTLIKVPVLPGFRPPSLFPDQPPQDDTISVSSRNKVTNLFEESDEEDSTPTHRPTAISATTNAQPSYFRGNQVERRTVNLFSDEPPPSSHEPTPTSSISNHSQKKPVNLFIDSDEDDSFNNNSSSKSSSVYQNEPPELPVPARKGSNLFNDGDNSDVTPKARVGKTGGNLFDQVNNNEADEEDDLFVPAKRSINGGVEDKTKGVRRVTNLFDDEPPEDDFDQIFKPKATDRKIPGAKKVLPPISKQDKEEGIVKKPNPQQRIVEQVPVVAQRIVKEKVNLFDDDNDDANDIFSESVTKKETLAPKKPKINLFDDDDIDEGSLLAEPKLSEDQINANDYTKVKPKETIVSQSSSIRSEILKKSIFDSDSNEDEDDFIFGGKSSVSASVTRKEPEPLPRQVEPVTPLQKRIEVSNDRVPAVNTRIPDDVPNIEKQSVNIQAIQPESNQSSIRSELLKKKSIFDSDSNEDDGDDLLFGAKKIASEVAEKKDTPKFESVQVTTIGSNAKVSNPSDETEKIKDFVEIAEKPPIPDEPPEDDGWASDLKPTYPEVSNDIDYYLTTKRINGPSESSVSTSLVQSNHVEPNTPNDIEVEQQQSSKEDTYDDSKPTTVEPPPDEEMFQSSNQEVNGNIPSPSSLPLETDNDAHKNDSSSNKSALNFNSICLFDDIPPPDDCFEEPRTTLLAVDHTDDGFYTEQPTASNSANANHYLFLDDGDGPPPDDEVDDGKVTSKIQQEPASFKSISAIIVERSKNDSSYEGNREKPKINRLSAKVNINVNALLPGARRPQPAAAVEKTPDITNSADQVEGSSPKENPRTEPKPQPDSETGSAKLVSLNKGRARIQTKRKPQSRQNRRSNYENSLASGTTEGINDHPTSEETPKEEVRVVVGSEEKTQHVEVIAAHVKVDQLLSNELIQKLSDVKLFENETDTEDKLFSNSITKPSPSVPIPKNLNHPVVAPAFESPKVHQPTSKPPISSAKLFSDEESDDSDLFGKISKPIAVRNPTASKPKQNIQPVKPVTASVSIKKQSIFGDSDDDDDLFSKPQSIAKPPAKPIARLSNSEPPKPVKKSIFESDGDSDDDDIFGGSKKGAVGFSNRAPTKKDPKMSKPAPPPSSKSLFGEDDDDDDDLFSSKSKSASKPTSSQPVVTTKKPERTTSVKAAVDDPLADLLK